MRSPKQNYSNEGTLVGYSSPMASLVLTDSFDKLPDQIMDWSPGGAPQQQLSVVTTVWGVTTSTQSGPHGGNVAAGAGYGQQQGPPNKQGTPFASVGYRQGAPPGTLDQDSNLDIPVIGNPVCCERDALGQCGLTGGPRAEGGSRSLKLWPSQ
uniref:Uncharacterized protein n=1 Tax=Timema douglasi TaxID=61478 RepID=A0A7R8Z8Z1_TIMDO|nr:unnamed protein product [Timema douglasi]